jgi:hypothetical protein
METDFEYKSLRFFESFMSNPSKEVYLVIYFSSLIIFALNILLQGNIYFSYYDSLGLILKMSPIFWLGYILLLILIYFHFVNFDKINKNFVYLTFILLTIYLIGTPVFLEYLPRYQDTWSHSFLANEIYEKGKINNGISYYEEYPGSFLLYGLLFQILPRYATMKFFPLFIYALGLISIYLIFKYIFNEKISFLATVLYTFFNWTAEDHHISPQFLTLYMYFLFMLVFVKLLNADRSEKKPYFFTALLFIPIIVFSHPGTPFFLILILSSILLLCKKFRGISLYSIIAFLVIFSLTYDLYQSKTLSLYVPHVKDFFRTLLSGELSSATKRFVTNQINRQIFLFSRMEIVGIFILFGVIGIYRFIKESYDTGAKFFIGWAFSMLILTIFVGLALEGEFYEKFVMIASLPLAAATAYSIIKFKFSKHLILVLLIILLPSILIAKYGNEKFESISVETLNTECFDKKFNTGCNEKQEIIDITSSFYLKYFGHLDLTITKQEIAGISIFENKNFADVISYVNNYAKENKLDKIYSTHLSGVYHE